MFVQVWMGAWWHSMDSMLGVVTLFISESTCNCGNVTRWLYLSALIESWLMMVDNVGSNARSWRYIQRSTHNHEKEGKTNNLGWMMYTVCAVLGVFSTWCQVMIMTWRDRDGWLNFVFCDDDRVEHDKERDGVWWWEGCGVYEQLWEIRGMTCLIGLGRPRIGVITCQIRTRTCRIGDGKLTCTQNSLKFQFHMMISAIPAHPSVSCPQLYHHLRTQSSVIALYLAMP